MKRYSFYFLFLLVIACQNNNMPKVDETSKNINEAQARAIAAEFIARQGYTSKSTNITMEEAQMEEEEFASSIEKLLESRHNILQPEAWEARIFSGGTHWAVGFNYTHPEPNIGRCVIMDTLGQGIYMRKGQIEMDWLVKDLPPEERARKVNELLE